MATLTIPDIDTDQVSDGYHTFGELYEHRIALWIALCRALNEEEPLAWRSILHSDGSSFPGWFLLGWRQVAGKQITYHLPTSEWTSADFATTLERAPEFDGHTSADVLKRIKQL